MAKREVGARIGAIVFTNTEKKTAVMFGYGTYQGEEVPPSTVIFAGHPMLAPNPKLVFDDGAVAWGCECWWGPEDEIKRRVEGLTITIITPESYRESGKKESPV